MSQADVTRLFAWDPAKASARMRAFGVGFGLILVGLLILLIGPLYVAVPVLLWSVGVLLLGRRWWRRSAVSVEVSDGGIRATLLSGREIVIPWNDMELETKRLEYGFRKLVIRDSVHGDEFDIGPDFSELDEIEPLVRQGVPKCQARAT